MIEVIRDGIGPGAAFYDGGEQIRLRKIHIRLNPDEFSIFDYRRLAAAGMTLNANHLFNFFHECSLAC
jgi:hypothetical protein